LRTRTVSVERFSIVSQNNFDETLGKLDAAIGHPDLAELAKGTAGLADYEQYRKFVAGLVGPSGLMEFMRLNIGAVLQKASGLSAPRSIRLLVGNPVIMQQMTVHVPDAASYAPVTLLVDERSDGVHLSYDRMASFLAPYGSSEALLVAASLDAKVEKLLQEAASK
jgi:uncharacterized protein (DUF302 family)